VLESFHPFLRQQFSFFFQKFLKVDETAESLPVPGFHEG
jgi:hypothetical protein